MITSVGGTPSLLGCEPCRLRRRPRTHRADAMHPSATYDTQAIARAAAPDPVKADRMPAGQPGALFRDAAGLGCGLIGARGICIVGVDVGSVAASNFAWAGFDAPRGEAADRGDDPLTAVVYLAAGLSRGQAALVLEAPMSVPVPGGADGENGWQALGKTRVGEGARPWSASAGAAVLATGLAQGAWMLRELASRCPGLTATTQPTIWRSGAARLLLAEAFVSGPHKSAPGTGSPHSADTEAAALALAGLLTRPDPIRSPIVCSPRQPLNLLAAVALWAGLHTDPGELLGFKGGRTADQDQKSRSASGHWEETDRPAEMKRQGIASSLGP